jgi:hypothetical protein
MSCKKMGVGKGDEIGEEYMRGEGRLLRVK